MNPHHVVSWQYIQCDCQRRNIHRINPHADPETELCARCGVTILESEFPTLAEVRRARLKVDWSQLAYWMYRWEQLYGMET